MWKQGIYPNANAIHEYSVNGLVRNQATGKLLSAVTDSHGYKQISYTNNDKKKKVIKVHRQIALLYLENPENKPCVNHKNGVRDDNDVNNLEWCTYSENNTHAYRILGKATNFSDYKGEKHYKSTPVDQYENGKFLCSHCSTREAEKKTGVAQQNISKVINGQRKKAGGFEWCKAQLTGVNP